MGEKFTRDKSEYIIIVFCVNSYKNRRNNRSKKTGMTDFRIKKIKILINDE